MASKSRERTSVDNLRIADGSIMPRLTTANTMAPCVIIAERAAEALQSDHRVSGPHY
jgi:choline dehydrogenase